MWAVPGMGPATAGPATRPCRAPAGIRPRPVRASPAGGGARTIVRPAAIPRPALPVGTAGLVDPADREKYLARLKETIKVCKDIGCNAGITCTGNTLASVSLAEQKQNVIDTLKAAAEIAEAEDFKLYLEALNSLVDHEGYFLDSPFEGADIIRSVSSPNIKLLYDVYHMQIMEGNVIATIERNIDIIGHFHAAGVPGRAELFATELNYPEIVKRIDALGYQGCFGLEYFPRMKDHAASLEAIRGHLA